jgi:tRNA(fMet)-specific endonuclease VapC
LLALPLKQRVTKIITVEEQLRGRFTMIARARSANDQAAAEFIRLKASVKHVGTQDLKIAAIVLSIGGVLVTCNKRDFARIPGLDIEDWTQS